ncbi:MAG: hypothetical protein BGO67_03050 [Alphaproteobacteria bacterium 41-28]|nr:MAG: hypothetical protein BGO67_03050 [Alphaproteobacteria bacterium 41-28]
MHHVITTYGGGELFTLVFNGIAALFKEDYTGMVMTLIRVGLMVGSVYAVILMLFRNQLFEGVKWFLWVVVATNLIFLPKTTIFIHDPLTETKTKIDNVPFALGVFASFVSQVGKSVTETFESVFTLPDYMPYHQTGTVFASALMSQVGQFRIVDPLFKGNTERFVNQCVVYDAMIGHKYTLQDLQNTPDIWGLVRNNASPVLGFLYKETSHPGTVISCKVGAKKLEDLWTDEINKATSVYGGWVQNKSLTKTAFFTHLQNGYQLMTDVTKDAANILRQEMMINAIEEASNNKLSELGSASNYAATKALLQQRSAYAIAGEIAARTLPLFKNVIEALSYALFIFIVVLALLPNGYRILLTYCGILVWTQLWAPLYAVLNLVMTLYGKAETGNLAANTGLNLLNSSAIINANADMVTLAAWLSVSIPFISYGILKQGAGAFVGLAQHLGSAMQSAASGAAAEAVAGNVSLGNLSMGTQTYQNTSAFQHMTSPSYNTSQFKALSASGVEQTTLADGTQAFSDQAMSRLSAQIMGTENTAFTQQENLSSAMSIAQTKSVAASKATETAFQKSTNFLSKVGKEILSGEDFNKTVSASDAKSLQNFKNYVNDIRQNTGMTEAQAVEAAVGASFGVPKLLGSGGISGNFESSAARQKGIDAAKSIASQKGYSDSIDKVVSAAQSLSEGKRDTDGAELGRGTLESLNQAKSFREEASVAMSQIDTISKDMSSNQSKNLAISKDLTQDVLEFIAHQPVNMGPNGSPGGQIGYERARQILEKGGEERAMYIDSFQEQNPQYAIESIHGAEERRGLEAKYDGIAQNTRDSSRLETQNRNNVEAVNHRARQSGLDPNKKLSENVKHDVLEKLTKIDDKFQKGSDEIGRQENLLQQAEEDSKKKNMTISVLKNAAVNVVGDLDPGKPILYDKTPPSSPLFKR